MARLVGSLARFASSFWVVIASVVLPFALAPHAAAAAPPQTPAFPAGVDVVRVDAVVLDRDGRPVKGLAAADFELLENGRRRELTSFEPVDVRQLPSAGPVATPTPETETTPRVLLPEEGRAVLVYFDDIHVQAENSVLVRSTLGPFLSRELRPGDAITIVAPEQGLWWTARTAWEHAQLPSVVERLRGQYVPDPFGDYTTDWLVMQHVEYPNVMVTTSTGVDPGAPAAAREQRVVAQGRRGTPGRSRSASRSRSATASP